MNILNYELWGNTIKIYGIVFLFILAAGVCAKVFSLYIVKYIKKITKKMGKKSVDIIASAATRCFIIIIYIIAFSSSMNYLKVEENVKKTLDAVIQVIIGLIIIYFIFKIVDVLFAFLSEKANKTKTKLDDALLPVLGKSIKIFFAAITLLFILNNLGYNVTAIITGLGVGSFAVALASQDTLKNFFGSIVIFADRPFNIGDRILVESIEGTVESIGFRSTRVRTLEGTLVTIPNSKMGDAIINNIQKRPTRKTVSEIGVTYNTSLEKLRKGTEIIRKILKEHPSTEDYLAHFNNYGPYSLNIKVIHWCKYLEYNKYLEAIEEINFSIKDAFEKERIEFAFPSQTIYINKETTDKRQ
ncbi:mechanosensitive ion channel family protein [Chlamydiota bacterium]